MIINLYTIRNYLIQGKKLVDLPLRVTYYARVSTNHEEQLNSLENQVMYFLKIILNLKLIGYLFLDMLMRVLVEQVLIKEIVLLK